MSIDLIIRGARVVTPEGVAERDLFIDGGVFVPAGGAARRTLDATGLLALPGVIDSHVHFNEPGRTEWEGIATGSAALAAGGGTCFFDMPLNSSPPTLDGPSFDLKRAAAEAASVTDFGLWGGLTPRNLDHLEALADRGVVGFKAFMCSSGIDDFLWADEKTLRRGMQVAAARNMIVAVHAESQAMTARLTQAARARGGRGVDDYLASRPVAAELEAIALAIDIAAETGCGLHVVHVSSAPGVELVRRAARGGRAHVTCETCPHYLALTADDMRRLGAPAKCAPPLRTAAEQEALWRCVESEGVAFVASDHSPAPASMKTADDFFAVWGGIAGVQSTLPILLTRRPALAPEKIARLTATQVAARYDIPGKGRIAPGFDADLALVDDAKTYTLRREELLDRHKQSPYVGVTFRGRVRQTFLRGRMVYADGKIVAGAERGRFVRR